MADIRQLAGLDTFDVPLTHPVTGKPVGGSVTVYGIYTDKFPEAVQSYFANGGDGDPLRSPAVLATLTKQFNDLEEDGEPFDAQAAERIYNEYPVIRRQVLNAIRDQRNFFPQPVTAQPST